MVTYMKTTVEISDHLLSRAKERAKEESVTLKAFLERALAMALEEPLAEGKVEPVTFKGKGLRPEFENASWETIRDAIY